MNDPVDHEIASEKVTLIHEETFTTEPKTRRRLDGAGTTEKRACGFMQFLWDHDLRDDCSYKTIYYQAIEYFGTNDTRTLERYIGRPRSKKKLPKRVTQVRNPVSGTCRTHEVTSECFMDPRVGYLEARGYLMLDGEWVVLCHDAVCLPYHYEEKLNPSLSLSPLESVLGNGCVVSKDETCAAYSGGGDVVGERVVGVVDGVEARDETTNQSRERYRAAHTFCLQSFIVKRKGFRG